MKKITRIFIAFIVILTSPSCQKKIIKDEHPIYKIFEMHEGKQLEKYHMKLVAAGIPEDEEVEKVTLHYVTFKKMKIPKVRELIVRNVEEFLAMVNSNKEVEPLLKAPPLTYNDIKFNIGFGTSEGDFQPPPYIAYAYLEDGVIYYCYQDEYFGDFTDEEDVKESYETALMILDLKNTID